MSISPPKSSELLIGDVARLSGLPIDTLRYYDRARLLGELRRNGAGQRVFTADTLGLLDVVLRLRRTGMPVKDIRRFVALIQDGDDGRVGRLALLRSHRARVITDLNQLRDDLAVIDWKIAAYTANEAGLDPPPPPPGWPLPQAHVPGLDSPDLTTPQESS